jgi:hypothetical protein
MRRGMVWPLVRCEDATLAEAQRLDKRFVFRSCRVVSASEPPDMLSPEPIFRIRADLADILSLGRTPLGERRVINILGGTVEGPRLSGRILPGGADWQIVRADGATDVQARYTIETDQGAHILVRSDGLRHGPAAVLEAIARGERVDSSRYYFRTVMRFEASDPAVDWLNRIIAVARGMRERLAVKLDVYEVL